MAEKYTLTDPIPTTHDAIRAEIKYWQDRFDTSNSGSAWETEVRKRLESLYVRDRASSEKSPTLASPSESRLRLLVGGLLQAVTWLGRTLSALLGRR
jgi:hypothetical protein